MRGSIWNSGSWKAAHNTDDSRERWSLRREDDNPDPPPESKHPKPNDTSTAKQHTQVVPTPRRK